MTYSELIRRGWYCSCKHHVLRSAEYDTWGQWKLCSHCRLPIKGSGTAPAEDKLAYAK